MHKNVQSRHAAFKDYVERLKPFKPDYVRLPPHGKIEPYSGLNRSALERLVLPGVTNDYNPPVQSRLFNPSGGKRWIRLIIYESLVAYLAKLPSGFEKRHHPAKALKVTTPRRRNPQQEVTMK
jgi:hypothetical protein